MRQRDAARAVPAAVQIAFGQFQLDLRSGELRKHGVKLRLPQQSFQVLRLLLDRPGEVVLREEIRQALWPNGTIVEFDHSINAAIKNLRAALSDSPEEPRYIETVGRKGYRFLAEVQRPAPPSLPPPEPIAPAGGTAPRFSLLRKLGSGSTGDVYLANDLTLAREVALKFVHYADSDPSAARRFRREALAAAALRHPHVCSIYAVDEHEGRPVIVMEFADGETLETRLTRGRLPLAESLTIAIQVAGALAEAQRKGVTHRDLKPANIMLTAAGVKILDFGLAKIEQPSDAAVSVTREGVILGTPSYMSPEQAQGHPVDTRSDIFSFGVVLYQMWTGRVPFEGDNPARVMAAILERDPAPANLPPAIERLILRCLAKDPQDRWQSAADLQAELEWIAAAPPTSIRQRRPVWIGAAAVVALAAALLAFIALQPEPPRPPVLRSSIIPPASAHSMALSPDGRRIAFRESADSSRRIWVQRLDDGAAHVLAGTEGGQGAPVWSPDSRFIAFMSADSRLKWVDADGGAPVPLSDVHTPRGASWSSGGVIVFAPRFEGPLLRVSAKGGAPAPATRLDAALQEATHMFPWFLPDGRHFLFIASDTPIAIGDVTIRLGSLDSLDSRVLLKADSHAIYAEGHLLYIKGEALLAHPFDLRSLQFSGDPVVLADHVQSTANSSFGHFSASETGLLAYWPGSGPRSLQLTWFDRKGAALSTVGNPGDFGVMNLSPDGKRLAVSLREDGNTDIWIYELERGARGRFTFDAAVEREAVWSGDGRSIILSSNRRGHFDLYRKPADGSGAEELLYADGMNKAPTSWSPDGRHVLYEGTTDNRAIDIWVLPLDSEGAAGSPFRFGAIESVQGSGKFSPDGRWVAYQSRETDGWQIYTAAFRPFPGPLVARRQFSTEAGGGAPRWRADAREIYFHSRTGRLIALDVRVGGAPLQAGGEHAIALRLPVGRAYRYDVTPDGQRVLAAVLPESNARAPFTLIQNWVRDLARRRSLAR
jgi:eukaryotic-like serine/threonine-protein kinase